MTNKTIPQLPTVVNLALSDVFPAYSGGATVQVTIAQLSTFIGSGFVTSVAQSFTGGLISVTGSPVTSSGTLALSVAGTSGGIVYFSAANTWASSGVLDANQIVLGGGAGGAPTTLGSLGTTTTVLHGNAAGAPTFGAVANSDLTNSSLTYNGKTVSLGGSATLSLASADFANQGTTTTVLHGNAAGNPSFAAIANADLTNSSLTYNGKTVSLGGSATLTLASADFANQGTTTTLLHGNAAGNPSFAQASLTADVTGILPSANGGTGINNSKNLTVSASLTLAGTDSTTMTFPPASASIGYLNVPQNSQSTAYTTVLADSAKHIFHPTADNNPRTFTIDSNANVAYPIGTAITFVNNINTLTIAITSDTMTLAGTSTTGSRTLAAHGIATALKIGTTEWIISGTGLS